MGEMADYYGTDSEIDRLWDEVEKIREEEEDRRVLRYMQAAARVWPTKKRKQVMASILSIDGDVATVLIGKGAAMNEYGAQQMNPAMFDQGAIWIDRTGKVWALKDLTDSHLDGICKWLDAWWVKQLHARYAEYSERPIGHVHSEWRTTTLGAALIREQDRRERSHRESAAGELEKAVVDLLRVRDLVSYSRTELGLRNLAHAIVQMMEHKGWKVERK